MTSSEREAWLRALLESAGPGGRLPTDAQLARQAGVSVSTMRRQMRAARRAGHVFRQRGRGTFAAGGPPADLALPAPPRTSAQIVCGHLVDLLGQGVLRVGQRLPGYDELCFRFSVGRHTVAAAVDLLVAQRHAHRAGRAVIAGPAPTPGTSPARGRVFIVHAEKDGPAGLFRNAHVGLALQRMEGELCHHGISVAFTGARSLPALVRRWCRSDDPPLGMVVGGQDEGLLSVEEFEAVRPLAQRLTDRHPRFRTLILTRRAHDRRNHNLIAFSLSHMRTMVGRALASWARSRGITRASLFFRDGGPPEHLMNFVTRHAPALAETMPGIAIRFVIITRDDGGAFRRRFYARYPLGRLASTIKSSGLDPRYWEERSVVVPRALEAWRAAGQDDLWVFYDDAQAAEALRHCRSNGPEVPRRTALITLEDGPNGEGLVHQITACTSDWERTGYLFAHALIGDVPLTLSRRGFLTCDARVLHRATTPLQHRPGR